MSAEEYEAQLAKLRQELADVTAERDQLIVTLEALFPIPTEAELAAAETNPGQLTRFIDSLAIELGVAKDGR